MSRLKESSPPSAPTSAPGSGTSRLKSPPAPASTPAPASAPGASRLKASSGLALSAGASVGSARPPGASGGSSPIPAAARGSAAGASPSLPLLRSVATPFGWASDTFCVARRLSVLLVIWSRKEVRSCEMLFSPLIFTMNGMRSSSVRDSRPSACNCLASSSTTKAWVSPSISFWPSCGKAGMPSGFSFTVTSRMLSGV